MNSNALPPSLDTWTIFFLFAAAQGLFFAIALFWHQTENKTANRLLGCFTLAFAFSLVDYVGFWTRYNTYFPSIRGFYEYLVFLFGPLLWLYFKAVFGQIKRQDWYHISAPLFFLMLKIASWQTWFPSQNLFLTFQAILMISHISIYGWLSLRYLQMQTNARNISDAQRKWYWMLLSLYGGFLLGWVVYFLLVNTPLFSLLLDYTIALAMTIFIYTAAFLGYKRPEIFQGMAFPAIFQSEKYVNSTLTPAAAESLMRKIEKAMNESKPYLDSSLRLSNFSSQVTASPHHVSQAINMKAGKSFPDYVNCFRFEHAKALLTQSNGHEAMVTEAMYAAGFNNKTSFNRIFKEQTGMTPTEYKASLKKEPAKIDLP
ncbi:MAG: AraC family transcriptional regulator [Saprospiraceae bacterium]|nr:AraC family transcriptional regulator [Saprospiraceae bacterium]